MPIIFLSTNTSSHVSPQPMSITEMNQWLPNEPMLGSNTEAAQSFVGYNSTYIDEYGLATDRDFSCTLEENIMKRGAMEVHISDSVKAETNHNVKDILCMYKVSSCTSEPNHQHQTMRNAVLDISMMLQIEYSPLLVPLVKYGYYVSCTSYAS